MYKKYSTKKYFLTRKKKDKDILNMCLLKWDYEIQMLYMKKMDL